VNALSTVESAECTLETEIELEFDQSKQNSLNVRAVFFSDWLNSNPISITFSDTGFRKRSIL